MTEGSQTTDRRGHARKVSRAETQDQVLLLLFTAAGQGMLINDIAKETGLTVGCISSHLIALQKKDLAVWRRANLPPPLAQCRRWWHHEYAKQLPPRTPLPPKNVNARANRHIVLNHDQPTIYPKGLVVQRAGVVREQRVRAACLGWGVGDD